MHFPLPANTLEMEHGLTGADGSHGMWGKSGTSRLKVFQSTLLETPHTVHGNMGKVGADMAKSGSHLDGSAEGHNLVGVDAARGLLLEHLLHDLAHLPAGEVCRPSMLPSQARQYNSANCTFPNVHEPSPNV